MLYRLVLNQLGPVSILPLAMVLICAFHGQTLAEPLPPSSHASTTIAPPYLIRSMQDVFLVVNGKRRWIVSPQVFTDYRFNEDMINTLSDDELNRIGLAPDLTAGPVLQAPDGSIWIVFQGSRHLVIADDAFPPLGLTKLDAVTAPIELLESYAKGRPYGNQTYILPILIYFTAVIFTIFYSFFYYSRFFIQFYKILSLSIFVFVIIMLLLKLYFISIYPWLPDGADAQAYSSAAMHLVQGNSLFLEDKYNSFIGITSPMYPIFLWIFSPFLLFFHGNVIGWKIAQILVTFALAIYTGLVGRVLGNAHSGRVAMMFSLCSPLWFYSSDLIQYELIFSFLLISGFYHYINYYINNKIIDIAVSGIAWGLAVFCQLKSVPLVGLFGIFLIWKVSHHRGDKIINKGSFRINIRRLMNEWLAVVIFFIATLTPTMSWGLRNIVTHDNFIIGSVGSGVVLWMGNSPNATGGIMGPSKPTNYDAVARRFSDDHSVLREARIYYSIAIEEILSNPERSLYLALIKFDRFWWALYPDRLADRLESRVTVFSGQVLSPLLIRALSMMLNFLTFFLAIYGLIVNSRWGERQTIICWTIFGLVIVFCLVHLPFLSEPRYRLPVTPFIDIIAVIGFLHIIKKFSNTFGAASVRDGVVV